MLLTERKLEAAIKRMAHAMEGPSTALQPVLSAPATGPMTPPPSPEDPVWQTLEMDQVWGRTHDTTWLSVWLQVPEEARQQALVLQLHWPHAGDDSLLMRLEATVYLDGQAIGAFDWRHPLLLLPEHARDGQPHYLTMQVYTYRPMRFEGLTLHARNETVWKLYHTLNAVFESARSLDENDIARHTLLERLNQAHTLLDLREGYASERFTASAEEALRGLQEHLADGLTSGSRPHMVVSGHAHLDLAWQWPYWRTRQKISHTLSNVVNLMERYPNYYYSHSQPQALQWVKEDSPELYERVKQLIAAGRIELVGAMWVEADCNLTSGESLVRQILHGKRFMEQEFGYSPRHVWLPDVFGYSAAMPQIMRGCDLPVFMTTKISWNQFNRMPCDTFRWRGIDGSEVLTHFVTAPDVSTQSTYYTYNGPFRASDVLGTWKNYRQQAINDQLLYLCGWGDGGGGPEESQLERSLVLRDLPGFPTVEMGRADNYFDTLYERVWDQPDLPTWVGELYLEYHRGTYTSQARTKQGNRRAELYFREVELLNAWAGLYSVPTRQDRVNDAWKLVLLNQFHDVLPGSSITEVYEDALRLYQEARAIATEVRDEALSTLVANQGWGEDQLVVLNTLPWERTDTLQIPVADAPAASAGQTVADWDGEEFVLLDGVRAPSMGVGALQSEPSEPCGVAYGDNGSLTLRNAYYELHMNANGDIERIYDRQAERDVLAPGAVGNQLIAYEDRPLNFDAWDVDIFYEEKPYPLSEVARVRVLEEGPVRVTVEVERPFMSSRVTQRISLWQQTPRIDFTTEIDWHEHQTLLKAAFPVAINSAQATYETQFGHLQRPTHRNTSWDVARFEVCAHRWIDLSESGYGVSLLNDSKYGHDVHDNVMRLTLLKSGISPDPQADQGIHRFTYSLLPHEGDWREAGVERRAYELNAPLQALRGSAPTTASSSQEAYSFLRTNCPHIIVETVKPAEDGDGIIVRLFEAHNRRGKASIQFANRIIAAEECNLLEVALEEATFSGDTLSFAVRPFEIKTFRIHLAR
ncbi:alpha-mannosidase [Ktedonospora formicarum]|uniref:alpha-mannosidase n=1 Tax=Ktedonospora formicarum TaxID=2778364 RepID=A0A8J3MN95_9CHLR|nr:alpha-mannosidase [Ktedonospora formicarum]GHO42477.1 alpha-mannosidase [Ktedonospora formicarum]